MSDFPWNSITQLAEEFALLHLVDNRSELHAEIKKRRADIHPDRTGGRFKSKKEERKYARLDAAVTYLEHAQSEPGPLVPVAQLPAIVESVRKVLAVKAQEPLAVQLEKNSEKINSSISHKFRTRKIGSAVFAAISGFLFTQADKIKDHFLVSRLLEDQLLYVVLIAVFATSCICFFITWFRERQEESTASYLMSEGALSSSKSMFGHYVEGSRISLQDLRRLFGGGSARLMWSYKKTFGHFCDLLKNPDLDSEVVDRILEVQIARLVERGVLTPCTKPSIDKWYDVHPSVLEELGK